MRLQGYRPQSAAPWTPVDVDKVVSHLVTQVVCEEGLSRVLTARDLFCLTAQWRFVSRGVTAVEWRLSDITLADGTPLLLMCVPFIVWDLWVALSNSET